MYRYEHLIQNIIIVEGTKTVTVTVTDEGGNSATASVVMTFLDSAVVKTPTTDRNWEFIGIFPSSLHCVSHFLEIGRIVGTKSHVTFYLVWFPALFTTEIIIT